MNGTVPASEADGLAGPFGELPADGLRRLALFGRRRVFPAGAVLVGSGQAGGCLYVLTRGRVRLERPGAPALAELGPGGVVGAEGLLDGRPATATARAVEETEALRFYPEAFALTLLQHPAAAVRLLAGLRRRGRGTPVLED